MRRLRFATFDVTNTLLYFRNPVGYEYAGIAHLYGLKFKHSQEEMGDKITSAFKIEWKKMKMDHPNFGVNTGLTSQKWWLKLVSQTFRAVGVSDSDASDSQLNLIGTHL